MKIIKKVKHRVTALVMSFFLALGLITPAFNFSAKAEAIEVMNGSCTIADTIFSYFASGGVAVLNETVINEVYDVLGSSFGTLQTFVDNGLLTYSDGTYVDSGLSTNINSVISNISSIDIGSLFNQTAEQNPAGVALTGASSLAGIAGSVASTGFLPVTAGVAISGYCGFQIGNIIANMIGLYGRPIWAGKELTFSEMVDDLPDGTSGISYYNGAKKYLSYIKYARGYCVSVSGTNNMYCIYNGSSAQSKIYTIIERENGSTSVSSANISGFTNGYYFTYYPLTYNGFEPIIKRFNSYDEFTTYRENLKNGNETLPHIYSPDVIGNNGNVYGNYNDGSYSVPDATSQVDEENQRVDPSKASFNDWIEWANQVKQNNTDPDTSLNNNKAIFDDIKSKIILPRTNTDPDPDPDPDPNPNPETVPVTVPNLSPYPDSYPVADPNSSPINKQQPQYTEKAPENETDITAGDPYTTPDLLERFPFCIPRDILRAFKKLDSGYRQAPHIQWRFHPNEMIDYTFDIDFSTWDNVAVLLRLLELLAFIILLGVATRNLILS